MKNDLLVFKYYTSFKMIFSSAIWQWNFTLFLTFIDSDKRKFWFFMFCIDQAYFYLESSSFSWS